MADPDFLHICPSGEYTLTEGKHILGDIQRIDQCAVRKRTRANIRYMREIERSEPRAIERVFADLHNGGRQINRFERRASCKHVFRDRRFVIGECYRGKRGAVCKYAAVVGSRLRSGRIERGTVGVRHIAEHCLDGYRGQTCAVRKQSSAHTYERSGKRDVSQPRIREGTRCHVLQTFGQANASERRAVAESIARARDGRHRI